MSDYTLAEEIQEDENITNARIRATAAAEEHRKNKNYYEILCIQLGAGASAIKKAYHMLSLKFHPGWEAFLLYID